METSIVQVVVLPWPKVNGTSWTINLDQPATAGNTLLVGAMGGAIATPSSPAGWVRPVPYPSPATLDESCWTLTAAGGETAISGSLNGSGDNVVLYAIELPGDFQFSVGSTNGPDGTVLSDATDLTVAPGPITVAAKSLLVGLFVVLQSTAFAENNQFIGCSPAGARIVSSAEQDASGTAVIAAATVADVDAGTYQATSQYLGSAPGKAYAVQLAFTNSGGLDVVTFANDIEKANAEVGRRHEAWYNIPSSGAIAGFPTAPSVLPGDDIGFKVDSLGSAWTCEIVRCGWNGHWTLGAHLVATLDGAVVAQPNPVVNPITGGTSMAGWTQNLTWSVPADATPGYYVAVFKTATAQLAQTHFLVRSPVVTGKLTAVCPDLTHQAYNLAGATTDTATLVTGRSVYGDGTGLTDFSKRAYGWTFDRPYLTGDTTGQTYIFDSEYPLLQILEAWGYDLAYVSDTDLETDEHLLDDAGTVLLLGHHEYVPTPAYNALQNAQRAGVNGFYYSANTAGWRIETDPGDPRTRWCYKTNGTRDIGPGWDSATGGTGFDPDGHWTGTWRDPNPAGGITNGDVRPDIALTGCEFVASGPVPGTAMTYAPSTLPHTRSSPELAAGLTDPTANLGFELDSANGSAGQPANLVTLYSTDVAITTGANPAGTIYTTVETISATQVLWRHSSGALVWKSAGWRDWWGAGHYRGGTPVPDAPSLPVQQYLANVLYDLGHVPATLRSLAPGAEPAPGDPSVGAPMGGRNAVAQAYGLTVPSSGTGGGFFALIR